MTRALVIGLDGATYDVLVPLAEEGTMPHLAACLRRAAMAELNSTRPAVTPVAWTTFQTGCDPERHGIFDYRRLDLPRGGLRLNHAGDIGGPTLLDLVSAAGGEVVSLGLPMSWPPRPDSRGIVVGGIESPSIEAALANNPEFARGLAERRIPFDLRPIWKRAALDYAELTEKVAATIADFRGRAAAAELADELCDWTLLFAQFQALDDLQHRAWRFLGVDPAAAAPAVWVKKTRETFRALDESLGRLFELAARRDAAVSIVSDHGFGPFAAKINVPELLRRRGLVRFKSGPSRTGDRVLRLAWKAKRWIAHGPHRTAAQVERPWESLLPIDPAASLVRLMHGDLGSLVYLNSRRRFDRGPLASDSQCEQAAADVSAAFREELDPQSGEPLFDDVFETRERFGDDPVARGWPDLIAIPAAGYHTRHKHDRGSRTILHDASLTGTHRPEGVLIIDAPGAVSARRHKAELRDVAPTLLGQLNLPIPRGMQGRPLTEMVVGLHSRREGQSASFPSSPETAAYNSADEEIVESRLRDLGYLE